MRPATHDWISLRLSFLIKRNTRSGCHTITSKVWDESRALALDAQKGPQEKTRGAESRRPPSVSCRWLEKPIEKSSRPQGTISSLKIWQQKLVSSPFPSPSWTQKNVGEGKDDYLRGALIFISKVWAALPCRSSRLLPHPSCCSLAGHWLPLPFRTLCTLYFFVCPSSTQLANSGWLIFVISM